MELRWYFAAKHKHFCDPALNRIYDNSATQELDIGSLPELLAALLGDLHSSSTEQSLVDELLMLYFILDQNETEFIQDLFDFCFYSVSLINQ